MQTPHGVPTGLVLRHISRANVNEWWRAIHGDSFKFDTLLRHDKFVTLVRTGVRRNSGDSGLDCDRNGVGPHSRATVRAIPTPRDLVPCVIGTRMRPGRAVTMTRKDQGRRIIIE